MHESHGLYPRERCIKINLSSTGVSCKLDIFIRSEGEADPNKTVSQGSSFLIVNGKDYSSKLRGFNIAVFDQKTGKWKPL